MGTGRTLRNTSVWAVVIGVLGTAAAACDEQKPKAAAVGAAAAAAASAAAPAVSRAAPEERRVAMLEVVLRPKSVHVGLDELKFEMASFDAALKALLSKVPVSTPDHVVLDIERKVSTANATKIFYALDDAGAKAIEVRTSPRGKLPEKMMIRTEKATEGSVPECTAVAMVLDDLGVTFWRVRGGLAKRYSKGMAGPDLSVLHEVMHKEVSPCESTVLLFSSEPSVDWGHAYDLAASVIANDPKYDKIDKVVLLRKAPVPGKPVKL
ncbi:MAG: hypothetical protein MUF54_06825 [Polyangiaceae bacterium]|jgi:hypothetical protein|nr:hypothetical protein [Polyangiaceae bacterium]